MSTNIWKLLHRIFHAVAANNAFETYRPSVDALWKTYGPAVTAMWEKAKLNAAPAVAAVAPVWEEVKLKASPVLSAAGTVLEQAAESVDASLAALRPWQIAAVTVVLMWVLIAVLQFCIRVARVIRDQGVPGDEGTEAPVPGEWKPVG